MNVSIYQTFSGDFDLTSKDDDMSELEMKIRTFMKDKVYSEKVEKYLISIICVRPEFDEFRQFQPSRPQYVEDRTYKPKLGFGETHIKKHFTMEIKLNYETFKKSDKMDGLRMIAKELMNYLENLKYPQKIKDFDKERFNEDMRNFFISENLLDESCSK